MGTADLAATVLRRLAGDPRWTVVLAVSQPDKPKGRDLTLQPTPVKRVALELGIPVDQPLKARLPDFLDRLRALEPALIVVAAYGQLLPQALLDIPRHGIFGIIGPAGIRTDAHQCCQRIGWHLSWVRGHHVNQLSEQVAQHVAFLIRQREHNRAAATVKSMTLAQAHCLALPTGQ